LKKSNLENSALAVKKIDVYIGN